MLLFALIKMAYPVFRAELMAAVAANPTNSGLVTILFLCEFFIPTARDLYFCLMANDYEGLVVRALPRAINMFIQLNNHSYAKVSVDSCAVHLHAALALSCKQISHAIPHATDLQLIVQVSNSFRLLRFTRCRLAYFTSSCSCA